MDLVAQRYLFTVSDNDGKKVLSDAWDLDTPQKPYSWQYLNPEGDRPSARILQYCVMGTVGMQPKGPVSMECFCFVVEETPQTCHLQMLMDYSCIGMVNGVDSCTGVSPSSRYQHASVFVGAGLHDTGGALKGGRAVDGDSAIAVLDTAAGIWLEKNGLVTSRRKKHWEYDSSSDSMRGYLHATASIAVRISRDGKQCWAGRSWLWTENWSLFQIYDGGDIAVDSLGA